MTEAFHNYSLDQKVIPMPQVANMVSILQRRGIDLPEQLEGTGIYPADLRNDSALVTYRQRIRQIENMLYLIDDRTFWLRHPREIAISDFGLLGYAMMSSATLERAVQIAVKYHKTAGAMFELTFVTEDNEAVLRVEHLLPSGPVAEYVVEELFQGIGPLIKLLVGVEHKARVVHLAYEPPKYSSHQVTRTHYEQAFNCAVKFGQQQSEYRFPASELSLPLAEADTNTARICEESCRRLLDQMEIAEDIVSRICHLLLSTPGEFPKLDLVAERLSMGGRTLRRRLKALGTSYQHILDDVRKELAMEYLQTTNLTVQEISDLLGYSEVTNFRRAFLKWAQVSPYQYRRQLVVNQV